MRYERCSARATPISLPRGPRPLRSIGKHNDMASNDILKPSPWGRGNPSLWQLKYEVDDERFVQILETLRG